MSDDDAGEDFSAVCKDLWMKPFSDVFAATWAGSLEGVQKFVEEDEDAASARDDTPCGQDNTALHYAAARGFADITEYLLSHRASVNAKNAQGVNPLFHAVQSQHAEVARLLLNGSDLCFVERSTNLTIGDLCAPPEEGEEADDGDVIDDSKNEPLRDLLLEKCSDFKATANVDVVRVGATTVSLQWAIPFSEGTALPVTRSVLKVYDLTDGADPDEPCKQHKMTTTTANATTSTGEYIHRHVVRNLRPRGTYAFSITMSTALQQGEEGERSAEVQLVREPGPLSSLGCHDTKKLDSVKLVWTAPASNGGAEVSGYQIQMQRVSGSAIPSASDKKWYFVRRVPAHIKSVQIPLHEGTKHIYYFRVAAENKLGTGPWTSTLEDEEQQQNENGGDGDDDDPLMRSLEVEADNEVDVVVGQERESSSNNNEEADAAAKAGSEMVDEVATVDDRVALDFQRSDVDGDGFLNQEEFTKWAAQRPDSGTSAKFDAVSFVDLCDENGCDDLKGIPLEVFRKLVGEIERKVVQAAEDAAFIAANAEDEEPAVEDDDNGGDDDGDDYSDEEGDTDANEAANASGDQVGSEATATSPKMREKADEVFQQFDADGDGFLSEPEYRTWLEDQGAEQFDGFGYSEVCEEHYAEEDVGLAPDVFTEVYKAFVKAKLAKLSGQLL